MDKIRNVWFEGQRICLETDDGKVLSRPLEAFPRLKDAPPAERNTFTIGRFGDDIRWDALDEDVHISSFLETTEPNPDNEVGRLFQMLPQLNVAEIAKMIGINKSLLDKYIYGIKQPTDARLAQIKEAIHAVGRQLIAV